MAILRRAPTIKGVKTLLICHDGSRLTQLGMSRWLASFSELAGVVVLRETDERVRKRVRREMQRVGRLRFLDVLAFRAYYRLCLAGRDRRWEDARLAELEARYPPIPAGTPILITHSPNSKEAEAFIRAAQPDLVIARCKTLLAKRIFTIPTAGTLVMHPGICPEYRNAHGCFWALANDDLGRVGMSLLKIDAGVDTGPIYAQLSYPFDERRESHAIIQNRVVFDNLPALRAKLEEVAAGRAEPIDIGGRRSAEWGQPWLSAHLRWKAHARRRAKARAANAPRPAAGER